MNYAFLLTGSNAAGKTTAVEKALAPWDDKHPAVLKYGSYAGGRIMNIRADNDGRFKGEADDQRRVLTEMWLSDTPILMIEGTRINTPLMDVAKRHPVVIAVRADDVATVVGKIEIPEGTKLAQPRQLTVLMALQTPDVMRAHMMARCEKKGKKYRDDYWSRIKLEYEGMKRYPNSFRKNGIKAIEFRMDAEYKVQDQIVEFLQARFQEILG